jgi:hypothetical protein
MLNLSGSNLFLTVNIQSMGDDKKSETPSKFIGKFEIQNTIVQNLHFTDNI